MRPGTERPVTDPISAYHGGHEGGDDADASASPERVSMSDHDTPTPRQLIAAHALAGILANHRSHYPPTWPPTGDELDRAAQTALKAADTLLALDEEGR